MLRCFHDEFLIQARRFAQDVLQLSDGINNNNNNKNGVTNLTRANVASLLKAIHGYDVETAYKEADWYFQQEDVQVTGRKIPFNSFLEKYRSMEGLHARLSMTNKLQESIKPVKMMQVGKIELIVPDEEAAALAQSVSPSAGPGGRTRTILKPFGQHVFKLNNNWMKNWNKRWLSVDSSGIAYGRKQQVQQGDVKLIELDKILGANPALQDSVAPKVKLKTGSFQITIRDGTKFVFAPETSSTSTAEGILNQWCCAINSHILLHAIHNNATLERITQIVELGADVNVALAEGKQYPALAIALAHGSWKVAEFLLRRGADASCLLRWSFLMEDKISSPVNVLQLLLDTEHDLNVCSDDAHGWTLLHYLVYIGDLPSVNRLLARVDGPTVRAVNTLGDCSLMLALKKHLNDKHLEEMALILAERADVNRTDQKGDTALHLAIKLGKERLATKLIELGADFNARDSEGNTCLHVAVKTKRISMAKFIAGKQAIDINAKDAFAGDTALVIAVKLGLSDLACFFIHNGATFREGSLSWGLNFQGCDTDEPLHVAIKTGMSYLAQLMVETASDIDILLALDSEGMSPLHLALSHGMFLLAVSIISRANSTISVADDAHAQEEKEEEKKSESFKSTKTLQRLSTVEDANRRNRILDVCDGTELGDTPLLLALRYGMPEIACLIVDASADPNAINKIGENSLHLCVELVSNESASPYREALALRTLRGLLELETQTKQKRDPDLLQTPLHVATLKGAVAAAKLLLAIDPKLADIRDGQGNTMISCAIISQNVELSRLAIDSNCVVDIMNNDLDTPAHLAVKMKSHEILTLLLHRGTYVGCWDADGNCPIHLAASENECVLLSVLAEHCTQTGHLELRNEDGYTAIMVAVAKGCCEAARLLISLGVDCRSEVPRVRNGLLQIGAQACRKDPVSFFRSGMASLLLGLKMEKLHIPTGEILADTNTGFTAIEARKEIEAAVQTVLDDGSGKTLKERNANAKQQRHSSSNTLLGEEGQGEEPNSQVEVSMKEKEKRIKINNDAFYVDNKAQDEKSHVKITEQQKVIPIEQTSIQHSKTINSNDGISKDECHQSFIIEEEKVFSPKERNKVESSVVSAEIQSCVLLELKTEAKETAVAWLDTKPGQNMTQKMVSIVKRKHPQILFDEKKLIQVVKNNFIKEHIEEVITAYENLNVKT